MTTIETMPAPFQPGYRYWTKVHRDRDGEVYRLTAEDLINAGVNAAPQSRHDGGLLVALTIPDSSTIVPNQPDGVARMRLPTGDILVARQRDTDPDGPWALSVERAADADHRESLRLLSERDARVGDWREEQQKRVADLTAWARSHDGVEVHVEPHPSSSASRAFADRVRELFRLGGETIVVRLTDDERTILSVHIAGEPLGPNMWARCRSDGLPMGEWPDAYIRTPDGHFNSRGAGLPMGEWPGLTRGAKEEDA